MIRAESLTKEYLSGGQPLAVLKDITFEIATGELVAPRADVSSSTGRISTA
jgi:ABC-type lipoprotein export system ATPase subunit